MSAPTGMAGTRICPVRGPAGAWVSQHALVMAGRSHSPARTARRRCLGRCAHRFVPRQPWCVSVNSTVAGRLDRRLGCLQEGQKSHPYGERPLKKKDTGMATNAALGGAVPPEMTLRRVVIAATIGNVLEWFDLVIYGFLAVTLAQVFFPTGIPNVSLWSHSARSARRSGARSGRSPSAPIRQARSEGRVDAVNRADDDWDDADGVDAELRGDGHHRAGPDHTRAPVAGIFGRRRIR